MPNDGRNNGNPNPSRDRYRDNDDARQPLEGDDRTGANADTKSEARGSARESVGNTARGAATESHGPQGNDKTRDRPLERDQYDDDLERRGS
jgi:hypothetical protein